MNVQFTNEVQLNLSSALLTTKKWPNSHYGFSGHIFVVFEILFKNQPDLYIYVVK